MDFIEPLLLWYRQNARDLPWRRTHDAYRIWISEIMLQQTRVEAVKGYYERFLASCPNVSALAAIDDDALNKLWEGLGYYSRAKNLKKAAAVILSEHQGTLPAAYDALLNLPGIGPYTAGAIASIAYGIPVPAVDGNVLRVMARLFNDPRPITDEKVKATVRQTLLSAMPKDRAGMFNQALMELGATVCLPNGAPHCEDCPVCTCCLAYGSDTVATLPKKMEKRPRRIEEKAVFALSDGNGRFLGRQRPDHGLLASLWQLPDTDAPLSPDRMTAFVTALGATVTGEISIYTRRHIFTHIEWHMQVFSAVVSLPQLLSGYVWLDAQHALPTAYRVCLPQ